MKRKSRKRITRTERAQIIAQAKAKGWTAEQVAKKFGVSKWTYYGWRKSRAGGAKKAATKAAAPAKRAAGAKTAKRSTGGRVSRFNRAEILAEMNSKGLTADQIAKKYGVSRWTVYGWRKRKSGGTARAAKPGRTAMGKTAGASISTASLRNEIRAALPEILRQEIARAIIEMVGTRTKTKRRRRGKK